MSLLRDELTDMVLEENTRWTRREIGFPEHERLLGSLEQYREAFVGRSHITIPALKTRFILYTDYPVTVGECARRYLTWCYEEALGGPPSLRPKWDHPWFRRRAPIYCDPCEHKALSYVDIASAYWQILRHYRADTVIRPKDRAIYQGVVPFLRPDEVDADRDLRHAVGGSLFASRITLYQWGIPADRRVPARFANPTLQMLAYGTLTAIAKDVRKAFGTHAWLTDAGIVWDPDGTLGSLVVEHLRDRWLIDARTVAWGMGDVWNASCYQVGDKITREYLENRTPRPAMAFDRVNVAQMRQWRLQACSTLPSSAPETTLSSS